MITIKCGICLHLVENFMSLYRMPDVDGIRPGPRVVKGLKFDADMRICKQCAASIAVCVDFTPVPETENEEETRR